MEIRAKREGRYTELKIYFVIENFVSSTTLNAKNFLAFLRFWHFLRFEGF